MSPEEHLVRWLASLSHQDASIALKALRTVEVINLAGLARATQALDADPEIKSFQDTLSASLIGG